MSEQDYTVSKGFWRVRTEGDVEGRSTRELGVFYGELDEIAFALADKAYYSLNFSKVNVEIPIPKNLKKYVSIQLDIESKTWDLTPLKRVSFFKNMLKDRPVVVEEGNYFASVKLFRTEEWMKTNKDFLQQSALNKLTDEEIQALGLEKLKKGKTDED